jgi:hypothetical protein
MNLIKRLFGGPTMQDVATEPTEAELAARLAEVQRQIAADEGDVISAMEEKERLERRIKLARNRQQRAKSRAYKEAITAKQADLNKRIDAMLTELGTHVPRLLFALQDFQKLVDEVLLEGGGDGRPIEERFSGLDFEFAKRARRPLLSAAVDWNYDAAFPGGKGSKPTPRQPRGKHLVAPSATDLYGIPLHRDRTYL